MKKKICILTSSHGANDIRVFQKEAVSLSRSGLWDIHYVVPHERDEVKDGVYIWHIPQKRGRFQRLLLNPWRVFFRALKTKADVYHFHDPELMFFGWMLKLFTGSKIVYDIHEDLPGLIMNRQWIPLNTSGRRIASKLTKAFELFFVKRFSAIITADYELAHKCLTVNKNTITLENFPILPEHLNGVEKKFENDTCTVVSFGGISPGRCVKQIVESIGIVAKDKKVKLILGGQNYFPDLLQELKQLPGWEHTTFVNKVSRDQMNEYMAKADISLVLFSDSPNHYTIKSNRFYETLNEGIPVITSNFKDWKEFSVKHQSSIAVNPADAADIASAITYMIEHPAEANQLGENGRNAVQEKFNWNKEALKLINLYKALLN